jgi:predicted nucleic acid-binding protein
MTPFEIVPGVDPSELADTSALARVAHHAGVRDALAEPLSTGAIAHCDITHLEMGLTARNAQEHIALGALLTRLPQVRITGEDYDRAWRVQGLLAEGGNHRGVAPPDLLVAACAERLGLTVIHCDADFDFIAEVTGQSTRWAVDRESL